MKKPTKKKIILIGAGIGGLSAGCYAQMSGFDTEIFEMHNIPGGQCTTWKRGGFAFDGSIHHLAGCKPGTRLYSMWEELGALPTCKVIFPEDMCHVEDETGKIFKVYVDLEQLRQHMLELSPQDASSINSYIKGAKGFLNLDMLETPLLSGTNWAKRFFKMASMMKWMVPMSKFAQKFKDPYLRKVFPTIQYDWPEMPMFLHLNLIGNSSRQNYGVPAGGSLEFSRAIERRYRKLGGTVHYNSRVEKILTEENKAIGVRLADRTEHRADIVISDAFAHSTIFNMLDGKYVNDKIKAQFAKPNDEVTMGLHVSFGLSSDLSNEPRALVLFLEKPLKMADREYQKLDVELFGYDTSLAPRGKSVLKVLMNTSYTFWKELHKRPEKYNAEKQLVASTVLKGLEKRFPGIQDQVEVFDVATPMTTERYTGVGHGYEVNLGFLGAISLVRGKPKTLPGLKNFHMIGSSAGAAGVPGCAAQGRNLIKSICKTEDVAFTPNNG